MQESPGGDLPPEPAIRAEATIPGKDIQLRMTIRRNTDQTLPASHIIEMIFLTPEGFDGGGVDNILRRQREEEDHRHVVHGELQCVRDPNVAGGECVRPRDRDERAKRQRHRVLDCE